MHLMFLNEKGVKTRGHRIINYKESLRPRRVDDRPVGLSGDEGVGQEDAILGKNDVEPTNTAKTSAPSAESTATASESDEKQSTVVINGDNKATSGGEEDERVRVPKNDKAEEQFNMTKEMQQPKVYTSSEGTDEDDKSSESEADYKQLSVVDRGAVAEKIQTAFINFPLHRGKKAHASTTVYSKRKDAREAGNSLSRTNGAH